MAIDWTKPVEGEFGDTRRRLYPLMDALGDVIAVDDLSRVWRLDSPDCPRLRNVAPKPVRHEAWINLYADGQACAWGLLEDATTAARADRVECLRIVWHSDGSPVAEDCTGHGIPFEAYGRQADEEGWEDQLRNSAALVSVLQEELDALKAECERLRLELEKSPHQGAASNVVKSCDNCANFEGSFACRPMNGLICIHSNHAQSGATDMWEPKR